MVLLISGAAVLSVVLVRDRRSGGQEHAAARNPSAAATAATYRGISLQIHSGDPRRPYEDMVREIAATGANAVNIVVHGYQENTRSSSVYIDARRTPGEKKLKSIIATAHEHGMAVMIMPVLRLSHAEGSWRGKIKPQKPDRWWNSYTDCICHFASIAEDAGVEIVSVGSELISMVEDEDRWRELIRAVRGRYAGKLIYSANWDWYKVTQFWDDLDLVGMTSYYTLGKGSNPSLREMLDTWRGIREEILQWRRTVGKPIIFTEVGWPNQETAAEYPWNYYKSPDSPDPRQQARCFESFFRTWHGTPGVAGYFIWEWRDRPDYDTRPEHDTSYCPREKPAMDILKRYFRRGPAVPRRRPSTHKPPRK